MSVHVGAAKTCPRDSQMQTQYACAQRKNVRRQQCLDCQIGLWYLFFQIYLIIIIIFFKSSPSLESLNQLFNNLSKQFVSLLTT